MEEEKIVAHEYICISSNRLETILEFVEELSNKRIGFVSKVKYKEIFFNFEIFRNYINVWRKIQKELIVIIISFLTVNLNVHLNLLGGEINKFNVWLANSKEKRG